MRNTIAGGINSWNFASEREWNHSCNVSLFHGNKNGVNSGQLDEVVKCFLKKVGWGGEEWRRVRDKEWWSEKALRGSEEVSVETWMKTENKPCQCSEQAFQAERMASTWEWSKLEGLNVQDG